MAEHTVVGTWVSAPGARDIVTGAARYCPDINLPGGLVGRLLYSPHARARIRHLDVTAARALPGVRAVLTHADVPGENRDLDAEPDQPLRVVDEVRFQGDAVAVPSGHGQHRLAAFAGQESSARQSRTVDLVGVVRHRLSHRVGQ